VQRPTDVIGEDGCCRCEDGCYRCLYSCSYKPKRIDPIEKFNMRKRSDVLKEEIVIDMPIQETWNLLLTPRMWQLTYPETISVGGITSRPMVPGDLTIERFLFGGILYGVINYTVHPDLYKPPSPQSPHSASVVFSGEWLQKTTCADQCCCCLSSNLGGTFEYILEERDGRTHWERSIYFYNVGGCLSEMYLRALLCIVWPSQVKGAEIFVNLVKQFVESGEYARDLYLSENPSFWHPTESASKWSCGGVTFYRNLRSQD